MIKLSLTVVAVMAMSIMIGSAMINVDAVKPHIEGPVLDPDCVAEDDGFCKTAYNFVCGTEKVSGRESIIRTLTTWENNNKYKLVTSHVGNLYESGTNLSVLVGTIDNTVTTQGFLEGHNGATVVKQKFTVQCVNGEKGVIEPSVTIIHPSKP